MPQVKMPDGTVVEMPETLTPELATRLKALQSSAGNKQGMTKEDIVGHDTTEPKDTTIDKVNKVFPAIGVGEAALATGSTGLLGLAAPVFGAGASMFGYNGKKGLEAQNSIVDDLMAQAYQPRTKEGQNYISNIGEAVQKSGVAGLAGLNEISMMGHLAPPAIQQARQIAQPVTNQISNIANKVTAPISYIANKVEEPINNLASRVTAPIDGTVNGVNGFVNDFRGKGIPEVKGQVNQIAKTAIGEAQAEQLRLSIAEQERARNLQSAKIELDKNIENQKGQVLTLDQVGEKARNLFNQSIKLSKNERELQANIDYPAALEEARIKEATGARVDVKPVLEPLKQLKKASVNIKDLETKINAIEDALTLPSSNTIKPPPIGKNQFKVAVKPKEEITQGKTFEQLQIAHRKLNDIAFNVDGEGYDSIITNAAKKAAKELDEQMKAFAPKHEIASTNYAKNSEALNTVNTRFGKLLGETEGGLKGNAFNKTSAQELPDKIFRNKEGIQMLKEAIAGGPNAPNSTVAMADTVVNDLVENWIVAKNSVESSEKALNNLKVPGMKSTLSVVPEVETKVTQRFQSMAAMERKSKELAEQAKQAEKTSMAAQEAANKMKTDLENADKLSKLPDAKSQQQALTGYMNTLARERNAGLISKEKYDAALDLVSKANTMEEKMARARRIAGKIAGLGTAVFVGKELSTH